MHGLSIIIPTLNEAAVIAGSLQALRAAVPAAEVLVVDGGSSDGTASLARPLATVLTAPPGRAGQMNLGAAAARGDWLLFLHADTRLPEGFAGEIARAAELGREAGAFRLRIRGRHPLLPLLGWGANLRSRWRGIALGDQAIFCTRACFAELGGFPLLPIMEDYAFSLRLRAAGKPLFLAGRAVETSGRRWDQGGFWRTWWQFRLFYFRFSRRKDLESMASAYRNVR